MILIHPDAIIDEKLPNPQTLLKDLERYARVSHKSEKNITKYSYKTFIKKIIELGHESILEHKSLSVRFIGDRGMSHELVRHRLAAYTQESTRYCDYTNNHITFIIPTWAKNIKSGEYGSFKNFYDKHLNKINSEEKYWAFHMSSCEYAYNNSDLSPQFKRGMLPLNIKTEIVATFNLRMWRHVFNERIGKQVHPQINNIMSNLLIQFHKNIPIIFDDIYTNKRNKNLL